MLPTPPKQKLNRLEENSKHTVAWMRRLRRAAAYGSAFGVTAFLIGVMIIAIAIDSFAAAIMAFIVLTSICAAIPLLPLLACIPLFIALVAQMAVAFSYEYRLRKAGYYGARMDQFDIDLNNYAQGRAFPFDDILAKIGRTGLEKFYKPYLRKVIRADLRANKNRISAFDVAKRLYVLALVTENSVEQVKLLEQAAKLGLAQAKAELLLRTAPPAMSEEDTQQAAQFIEAYETAKQTLLGCVLDHFHQHLFKHSGGKYQLAMNYVTAVAYYLEIIEGKHQGNEARILHKHGLIEIYYAAAIRHLQKVEDLCPHWQWHISGLTLRLTLSALESYLGVDIRGLQEEEQTQFQGLLKEALEHHKTLSAITPLTETAQAERQSSAERLADLLHMADLECGEGLLFASREAQLEKAVELYQKAGYRLTGDFRDVRSAYLMRVMGPSAVEAVAETLETTVIDVDEDPEVRAQQFQQAKVIRDVAAAFGGGTEVPLSQHWASQFGSSGGERASGGDDSSEFSTSSSYSSSASF